MVFLVITREGFLELQPFATPNAALWLNVEVATESEVESLRARGINVTVLAERLDPGGTTEQALETINEHHPGETLWLETRVPD